MTEVVYTVMDVSGKVATAVKTPSISPFVSERLVLINGGMLAPKNR